MIMAKLRFPYTSRTLLEGDREPRSTGKGQTVPNEVMSIGEILLRFSKGMPLSGSKVPASDGGDDQTFDSPDLQKLSKMDIFERQEYAEELGRVGKAHQEKLAKRERIAAKKAADQAAKDKQDFEEWKKQQGDPKVEPKKVA